jgi:hypothetical protein
LRIAIAKLNGTVTAISAHTPGWMAEPPPKVWLKCSHTPRLTTSERTNVIDSEASAGKRLSRSGGTEYAVPTARPMPTATSSAAPCVIASATGTAAATATIQRPASGLRSPAAMGSAGLLMRSISTSSSWLMPTMKTFTHHAATSVIARWKGSAVRSPAAKRVTAIA